MRIIFDNIIYTNDVFGVGKLIAILYKNGIVVIKGSNGQVTYKGIYEIVNNNGEYTYIFMLDTAKIVYYEGCMFSISPSGELKVL